MRLTSKNSKHNHFIKENGLLAWIDQIEGKKITVTPFSTSNIKKFDGDFSNGNGVVLLEADEELNIKIPSNQIAAQVVEKKEAPGEGPTCSGSHWIFEAKASPDHFRKGNIVRLYNGEMAAEKRPRHREEVDE